jgi:hypothetical protein
VAALRRRCASEYHDYNCLKLWTFILASPFHSLNGLPEEESQWRSSVDAMNSLFDQIVIDY